ncbi:MAG: hypothetical protein WC856_21800 [Methylococcaceae bacterium]|jgi:hypothetical protein
MTFKIENNTATSECEIDNCKVTLIIERLDGKDITTGDAEIVCTSAMHRISIQKTGELTK